MNDQLTRELSGLPANARNVSGGGRAEVEPLPEHGQDCPKCGEGKLATKASRKDPAKRFLSCNLYPKCDFSKWPEDAQIQPLPGTGDECPSCKVGHLRTRATKADRNRRFLSCDTYPACNFSKWPDDDAGAQEEVAKLAEEGQPCTKCRTGSMKTVKVHGGKNVGRRFLVCSNKPECDAAVFPSYEWPAAKNSSHAPKKKAGRRR